MEHMQLEIRGKALYVHLGGGRLILERFRPIKGIPTAAGARFMFPMESILYVAPGKVMAGPLVVDIPEGDTGADLCKVLDGTWEVPEGKVVTLADLAEAHGSEAQTPGGDHAA